jgi:hypothetical protein
MKVFVDENIKQKISHPRFIHLLTSMVALGGNWTEPTQRSHKVSRYDSCNKPITKTHLLPMSWPIAKLEKTPKRRSALIQLTSMNLQQVSPFSTDNST